LVVFLFNISTGSGEDQIACIIMSLVCAIYLGVSIRWSWEIQKYTSSKDDFKMRKRHFKYFIQYALDTGHDTKEKIKERLGKSFWNKIYGTLSGHAW